MMTLVSLVIALVVLLAILFKLLFDLDDDLAFKRAVRIKIGQASKHQSEKAKIKAKYDREIDLYKAKTAAYNAAVEAYIAMEQARRIEALVKQKTPV